MLNPLIAGLSVAITKIVEFVKLLWGTVVGWFQQFMKKQLLTTADKEGIEKLLSDPTTWKNARRVPFTFDMGIKDNKRNIAQGVFNDKTEKLEDGLKYVADEIDGQLENYHRSNKLVIYG